MMSKKMWELIKWSLKPGREKLLEKQRKRKKYPRIKDITREDSEETKDTLRNRWKSEFGKPEKIVKSPDLPTGPRRGSY